MIWSGVEESGEVAFWAELPDQRWISVSMHDGDPNDWQWMLWDATRENPEGFRYGFPSADVAKANAQKWGADQFDQGAAGGVPSSGALLP